MKFYLENCDYLVGFDLSASKIAKVKNLCLYDDLVIADAQIPPFKESSFDLMTCIEVLHFLPVNALSAMKKTVHEGDPIILTFPYPPEGINVKDLIDRGYNVYRYLLRGLIIIDQKDGRILLARNTTPFKIAKSVLKLFKPLLAGTMRKGYLLAFSTIKEST